MDDFFTNYWPEVAGVLVSLSALARVIITKIPATAKYLKYVASIINVVLYVGKAVKDVKAKSKAARPVHSESDSVLEKQAGNRPGA